MFRVDPAFKVEALFAAIRVDVLEDYHFLQLTQPLPIWIVHMRNKDWVRYMFNYLPHALEALAVESLQEYVIYVLWPEHTTATGKLSMSQASNIYECRRGVLGERRFEITAESGKFQINEWGAKVRKTLRMELLLTC